MDRVKKILGRLFIVLFASMSVVNVVKAAENASTEVQVTIEAPEMISETNDEDGIEDNIESNLEGNIESVKTGDDTAIWVYVVGAVVALAVVVAYFGKRKGKKAVIAGAAILLSATCFGYTSRAADTTENVSVTIPTNISVVFDETGTTSISEFEIQNQSLVPITFEKIHVTECNDWKLATTSEHIPVNTKKLAFSLEEHCLLSGENVVEILVPEETSQKLDIQIARGAWTDSELSETALNLEFEYTLGTKAFELSFDANGGNTSVAQVTAYNGDVITLPKAEREYYVFEGWQDEEGNLYTTEYVMPIGNVKLTAKWKETDAYAVYSEDDRSLTFYRSETPISVGTTYNGKTVTAVYAGFEKTTYTQGNAPWYAYNNDITSIVFHDKVSPVNTDYWFHYLNYVTYADVAKLNMSKVTSMEGMFGNLGVYATEVIFNGLENWDVSRVSTMYYAFSGVGSGVNVEKVYIGDLSRWDVYGVSNMKRMFSNLARSSSELVMTGLENWNTSKVTMMDMMFYYAGYSDGDWTLDLSGWNIAGVKSHVDFSKYVENKIVSPKWKK